MPCAGRTCAETVQCYCRSSCHRLDDDRKLKGAAQVRDTNTAGFWQPLLCTGSTTVNKHCITHRSVLVLVVAVWFQG